MSDITCTFAGDREETIIAYLYDDIGAADRAAFDAHLPQCARCRRDLAALGGVRRRLASWEPPQVARLKSRGADGTLQPSALSPWYRQLPAWAQAAAALLFLGVSAAVANLDIRYDANGLGVRTGWMKSAYASSTPAQPFKAAPATPAATRDTATHDELTALEARLRNEMHTLASAQTARSSADAETLRRVRALVDESEKREQRELALRVAQVLRDVNAQRQADLSKIDRNLGVIQNNTGVEILKQREMVNYLMRVSQRQ